MTLLLDPRHPIAVRLKLPLYTQKTIIQIRVAVIYRLGGVMSPVYAIYKAPEHYLANLEVILSPRFPSIPSANLSISISHHTRGKEFFPKGGARPGNQNRPTPGSHLWGVLSLLTPWQQISPDTPLVVQNHIPGTQIHSPENFRKFGKVASSFCGGMDNYLTNEGIGAIYRLCSF